MRNLPPFDSRQVRPKLLEVRDRRALYLNGIVSGRQLRPNKVAMGSETARILGAAWRRYSCKSEWPAMLTPRQAETLKFVEQYILAEGRPPSFQEVTEGVGLSSRGSILRILRILDRKGYIKLHRGQRRAMQIVKPQSHLNPEYRRGWRDAIAAVREMGIEAAETLSAADPPSEPR